MTFQNKNTNTPASGGGGFLKLSEGALLTPAAGVITPTDSVHHVAAGTISSIATTNLDSNVIQPLTLIADGAVTITLGATIVGRTTALILNDAITYLLDGGVWHEVPCRPAAAGTLTGTTLPANVVASSLTSFGASPSLSNPALASPAVTGFMSVASAVDITLVNGNNNDVAVNGTWQAIAGPTGAFTITGVAGGTNGKIVVLLNTVNQNMTISFNNALSAVANRILSKGFADVVVGAYGAVTLWYRGSSWQVVAVN